MSNGQILLLILELSALVLYIVFAAIYHGEAKGYSKISFRTYLSLYKAAPVSGHRIGSMDIYTIKRVLAPEILCI